ncbi:phage scaffolding protein [Geobacillus thermoleovorans]
MEKCMTPFGCVASDKDAIELDENGNITKGLDEQLKTLQETKSFLFVPENNHQRKLRGSTS